MLCPGSYCEGNLLDVSMLTDKLNVRLHREYCRLDVTSDNEGSVRKTQWCTFGTGIMKAHQSVLLVIVLRGGGLPVEQQSHLWATPPSFQLSSGLKFPQMFRSNP
ncbi:hypothetical protein AMECASPLE_035547 [Ameca splendens]|uniref:Uncharacterized protein n=1 Tax=Ameca splendens TaxID=208324 RepID=A0ABV0XKE8_9TELE